MSNPVRIPPVPREKWTTEHREVFAFWGDPTAYENGSSNNLVMVMANNPKLGMAFNQFGKHMMTTRIPPRPRELMTLRIVWHLKNEYEWHYHIGYAIKAGLSIEEIEAIKTGPDAPNWNDDDRAVLKCVDELWETNKISDATWTGLMKQFDTEQVMDFIFILGQYVMLSWAIDAFGVQMEAGVDQVGFDLKTKSGELPQVGFQPAFKD
jgi:alkylhydroperoxidase/carboxymuconolactone decarboxylase family protein YurZ